MAILKKMALYQRVAAVFIAGALFFFTLAYLDYRDGAAAQAWPHVKAKVSSVECPDYAERALYVYDFQYQGKSYNSRAQAYDELSHYRFFAGLYRPILSMFKPVLHLLHIVRAPEQFTAKQEANGHPSGSEMDVLVDPKDPQRSLLAFRAAEGGPALGLLLGGLGLALGGVMLLRNKPWIEHEPPPEAYLEAARLNSKRRPVRFAEGQASGAMYMLECRDMENAHDEDAGVYFMFCEDEDEVETNVARIPEDDRWIHLLGIFNLKRPLAEQGLGVTRAQWISGERP